jgi:transcriptional regulator with XRE-family HTH domain
MAKQYTDLADFLEKTGERQEDFAARVGTTQAHISRIVNGESMPRPELAEAIAAKAHIPIESLHRVYLAKQRQEEATA